MFKLTLPTFKYLFLKKYMTILLTGGAGYIGSITAKHLQKIGADVIVLDNLKNGYKDSIKCPLIVQDLTNKRELFLALKNYNIDAVIHFAASTSPNESMSSPYSYFHNNIQGGLNLLELMKIKSIPYIVYSSSCAVYGSPKNIPVRETDRKRPISVYGESKLMFESILKWYAQLFDIKYISLRYFNVAGASLDGSLGENHKPETHIIPNIIKCIIEGKRFQIFGKDFNTPDGTCIRDYIHVEDLALAHVLALNKLKSDNKSGIYNLGSGIGYSNLEIIKMIEKTTGLKLDFEYSAARTGDPPIICANIDKAIKELKFKPKYSDLKTIIKTAYEWHSKI